MQKLKTILSLLLLGAFLTSCASHSSQYYFGTYSEAEKLYGQGQYEKAIGKYQAYLGENPQGNMAAIAEYYIAKSDVALGKSEEAKTGFQKVIDRYPKTSWAGFAQKQLDGMGSQKKA